MESENIGAALLELAVLLEPEGVRCLWSVAPPEV